MNPSTTTSLDIDHGMSVSLSLLLQLAAGALLGLVTLYGVNFSEVPFAHNATHDVRHITVMPCH